eukprot:CAMPEP_0183464440 /NCGR_PEP_ID=MMETSP0370-20130417/145415_1 /TAXON_ID=268820 /ORGANISM="Peridinium aciculiferum, Strain PAER-2" /LENGTH=113 /DNA_ID=CAMNT_0025656597 /DNA_START=31 /DNA_END=369 /DNA_ORIENTATION=-
MHTKMLPTPFPSAPNAVKKPGRAAGSATSSELRRTSNWDEPNDTMAPTAPSHPVGLPASFEPALGGEASTARDQMTNDNKTKPTANAEPAATHTPTSDLCMDGPVASTLPRTS